MRHPRSFIRLAALVASAGMALSIGACDDSDSAQVAIEKATVTLNGLGASGSMPIGNTPDRKSKYQGVIAALTPIAGGESSGSAAAASILVSRGHSGLGEMSAQEAAGAEGRWVAEAAQVASLFDRALSQRATADALASFDPTPQLAEIDDQVRQREAEAGRALAEKQKQLELVNGIRAKADQARAQAQAERRKEAEIRARAQGVSQTAKAQIIEEATEVKRRGDAFEKQAADFDADAAKQAPEVDSLQLVADKLKSQVDLLREARQSHVQRAEASRAQAGIAATEANETFEKVNQSFAALTSGRAAVEEISDSAAKAYQQAIGAAKKAGNSGKDLRSSASIIEGSAQQALGDLLVSRYRSLKAYAVLAGNLARAGKGGVTADSAKAAQDAAGAAKTAAQDAYKAAFELFERGKSGGAASKELNDRLDKLADRLKALSAESDKPAAAPADFDKAAVEKEVRDTLCMVNEKVRNRDFAGAAEFVDARSADDKEIVELMTSALSSGQALSTACKDKLGKDLLTLLDESENPQIKPLGKMLDSFVGSKEIEKANKLDCKTARIEVVSPTQARVFDDPEKPEKTTVVNKVEGKWMSELGATPEEKANLQQAKAMKPLVKGVTDGFKRLADGLNAGKIADAAAFEQEITKEMMMAMMRAGGGGRKPAGGGNGGGGDGGGGGGGGGGG
ncbi:MAG: hypothetical protein IT438_14020 [Phycisphaerales bacterium]|nr:hypothetical protein [Phycisphaerales bacterium]